MVDDEQYNDTCTTSVDELYLGLARWWGQRIQFVAPLQTEAEMTKPEALSHVPLEPDVHQSVSSVIV